MALLVVYSQTVYPQVLPSYSSASVLCLDVLVFSCSLDFSLFSSLFWIVRVYGMSKKVLRRIQAGEPEHVAYYRAATDRVKESR